MAKGVCLAHCRSSPCPEGEGARLTEAGPVVPWGPSPSPVSVGAVAFIDNKWLYYSFKKFYFFKYFFYHL